jgi:hypothetical protein
LNPPLQKIGQRLIVTGLVIQVAALLVIQSAEHPSTIGLGAAIAAMIGTAVYMTGFAYYARAKGRNAWWCLLGLLSLFGLTVLLALPDFD